MLFCWLASTYHFILTYLASYGSRLGIFICSLPSTEQQGKRDSIVLSFLGTLVVITFSHNFSNVPLSRVSYILQRNERRRKLIPSCVSSASLVAPELIWFTGADIFTYINYQASKQSRTKDVAGTKPVIEAAVHTSITRSKQQACPSSSNTHGPHQQGILTIQQSAREAAGRQR